MAGWMSLDCARGWQRHAGLVLVTLALSCTGEIGESREVTASAGTGTTAPSRGGGSTAGVGMGSGGASGTRPTDAGPFDPPDGAPERPTPPDPPTNLPDASAVSVDAAVGPRDTQAAFPTPPAGKITFGAWPGTTTVTVADQAGKLGGDLSGLAYLAAREGQPAALLVVQNSPGKLYRLTEQGTTWGRDPSNGWSAGKTLRFPVGNGEPDAEGVTVAESPNVVYVSSESDSSKDASRLSVLRFDTSVAATTLIATNEWNLTADLPKVDVNAGLESIAWVPDSYLVGHGFWDESANAVYQPSRYADHGTGLIFVGLEDNGVIYAYALDHRTGMSHRLATIPSGQPAVMDLSFDADRGVLFAACDDTCTGHITLLAIDANPAAAKPGRFVIWKGLARPTSMPNTNNEGITFAPIGECMGGQRRFFWVDDAALDEHALRKGSLSCDPLF